MSITSVINSFNKAEPFQEENVRAYLRKMFRLKGVDVKENVVDEFMSFLHDRIYEGIKTTEIRRLLICHAMSSIATCVDAEWLATYIAVDRIRIINKERNLLTTTHLLQAAGIPFAPWYVEYVEKHSGELVLNHERDYLLSYFGISTLESKYLLRDQNITVIEQIQFMWMRVAIEVMHSQGVESVQEYYDMLSMKYCTHATPTLYHAGFLTNQLSSCFLMKIDDTLTDIYRGLTESAIISKHSGGMGIHIHTIRANNSYIHSTGGRSNGIIPMLRVMNESARYADQGGGKRPGSFAVYLEPWHADVEDFVQLRRPSGDENRRCRDLFIGLWVCDLFMERVLTDGKWTLMCPNECPGLSNTKGEDFVALYEQYEHEGRGRKEIPARDLWKMIAQMQIETGMPYMLYKDHCNNMSNQQHCGVIGSSNLCAEIVEYSDAEETAVCNLASIALPAFYNKDVGEFDWTTFEKVVYKVVMGLNCVIDQTFYPIESAKRSNERHRPMGVGVQGLADLFQWLNMPFASQEARLFQSRLFETMYFVALTSSVDWAEKTGKTYETFVGSPMQANGYFQFDLYEQTMAKKREPIPEANRPPEMFISKEKWDALRSRIQFGPGLANSLLIALMPTASTAQILGNTESFEPAMSNYYVRNTSAGSFPLVNPVLMDKIKNHPQRGDIIQEIISNKGSVAKIGYFTPEEKEVFKTVYEIGNKAIIQLSADRTRYVCQSQSLNLFVTAEQATISTISSILMFGWKLGLKTGVYYMRTQPAFHADSVVVSTSKVEAPSVVEREEENSVCEACSA